MLLCQLRLSSFSLVGCLLHPLLLNQLGSAVLAAGADNPGPESDAATVDSDSDKKKDSKDNSLESSIMCTGV